MIVSHWTQVDDCRETPAFPLIKGLLRQDCVVEFHDPHLDRLPMTRLYPELVSVKSVDNLARESLSEVDAIVVF
jgi:UDP-N-acetyl-D-glucosamine dehydrogenase